MIDPRSPARRAWLRQAGLLLAGAATFGLARAQEAKGAQAFPILAWPELVPPGWDPAAALREVKVDPLKLLEGSADEGEAMRKMREVWDNAPTRRELQGRRVRIPGYVVPLEAKEGAIREFLLVPYFGACIHSPPPPANQMVLVRMAKPATVRTMDPVWVSGTLRVERLGTEWGLSGYVLEGQALVKHEPGRNR